MAINLSIKNICRWQQGCFLWCGKGGGDSYLYMGFFLRGCRHGGNCYR